jgi:hypothetical protein
MDNYEEAFWKAHLANKYFDIKFGNVFKGDWSLSKPNDVYQPVNYSDNWAANRNDYIRFYV